MSSPFPPPFPPSCLSLLWFLSMTSGHSPFLPLLRPRTGVLLPGLSLLLLSASAHVTCLPTPHSSTGNVKNAQYTVSRVKLPLGFSMAARAQHGFSGPWRAAPPILSQAWVRAPFLLFFPHFLFPSPTWLPPCLLLLFSHRSLILPSFSLPFPALSPLRLPSLFP